jgi:hypothetical protein
LLVVVVVVVGSALAAAEPRQAKLAISAAAVPARNAMLR